MLEAHISPSARNGGGRIGTRAAALLALDPELGADLSGERLATARSVLRARTVSIRRGVWPGVGDGSIGRPNVGLLVVEGVVAREVVLENTVSTELLGAGDVIRPWSGEGEPHLLDHRIRWQVLTDARLALLGQAFAAAVAHFPEVNAVLIDRMCMRADRLATMRAISDLNAVDRRLLALFWHLAERWGRVTPEGVVIPLTLSHRLLGELVGARRPTVTVAIRVLERDGSLRRRSDATWLLTGERAGTPAETVRRVVSHRRRLFPTEATGSS
jgi:CRP/FNR family transcriptional regulator, cyclic AMP receptor protein